MYDKETKTHHFQNWKLILWFFLLNGIYIIIGMLSFEGGVKKIDFFQNVLKSLQGVFSKIFQKLKMF